ncbi:MAG TPA: pyridoxal-phosphate dependent enzyme [Acidobacteriaceae bacterium]|nr:pyridoxal-phosphate dependent enzyme [Acidobacteriaceae bacterium]
MSILALPMLSWKLSSCQIAIGVCGAPEKPLTIGFRPPDASLGVYHTAMPVSVSQAEEARRNIAPVAVRTPLVRCNTDAPADIYLKLENLQPIGSFKIRGAANVMAMTPRQQLDRGVLTASAGNMAQGVAFCARRLGIRATIVAPETAPAAKTLAVERMGGHVIKVPFAEWWQTFETRAYPGVDATFIHAFDDPYVMAGNATIALELLEDLPDLKAVVIPWGGGGLSCGIAAVLRALAPHVDIYAAEIETAAPLAASLAAGEPRVVDYKPSFVDGIGAKTVFPGMFEYARTLLTGSLVVSLQEAAQAMKLVAERNRIIIEGAAACAVAAACSGRAGSGKIVAIVSGGNIDLDKFAQLVAGS